MKRNPSSLLRKLLSIAYLVEMLSQHIALEKSNGKSQSLLGRIVKVHHKFQSIKSLFFDKQRQRIHLDVRKVFIVRKNGIDLGTNAKTLLYD